MYELVYVSTATAPLATAELLGLLARCRESNARIGVTGMLLYKDGNFMQALEGDERAVRDLHARIERDPRHRGLLTLVQGPIAERQFPQWSMGFRDLHAPDVASVPGFNAFLHTSLTGKEFAEDPSRCQRLLLSFKKAM